MRSKVADDTRAARLERELALAPEARVRLALDLGRRARALFAAANGLTSEEARIRLEANKQSGRR